MNGADTAWIMVATALVLFMTIPGLALFYGGLVRARNVLSVFMQCFAIACLMSILWLAFGYSIAFGTQNIYWGGLDKAFLIGITSDTIFGTIPEVLFFAFQISIHKKLNRSCSLDNIFLFLKKSFVCLKKTSFENFLCS